jgi:hypothetical protein
MIEFIIGIVCVFIGWKLREAYAVRQISRIMKLSEEHQSEVPNKQLLKLEKHSAVIYAFDSETDQFLGQGESLEDLVQLLVERFPDKRFTATPDNLKELGLYNESV